MPVLQLRNHIPIGGPARREPADGTETAMRVSLGFEPDWFHRRCQVDLDERWHTDPYERHRALVKMKQELCRAFPSADYWDLNRMADTWTLSGCYGVYVMNRVFGFALEYAPNLWPWPAIDGKRSTTLAELVKLKPEALLAGPFIDELFKQMDIIEAEAGQIHGYLNWQGVLNNAFNLLGQQIYVEMVINPKQVHDFFALLCEVMIAFTRMVQARQRESGFYLNQFSVSNCTISMISPRHYREFVLPYDKKIAESFERFGVHTCNWKVDPYLDALAELPRIGYLDMGIMSDLKRARAMFPEARRAVMLSPVRLHEASREELQQDMEFVYHHLAPCDVVMADIQAITPDERVNELLEICRALENED